jgi:hypothetical protein
MGSPVSPLPATRDFMVTNEFDCERISATTSRRIPASEPNVGQGNGPMEGVTS